jgi:hypothetical protein
MRAESVATSDAHVLAIRGARWPDEPKSVSSLGFGSVSQLQGPISRRAAYLDSIELRHQEVCHRMFRPTTTEPSPYLDERSLVGRARDGSRFDNGDLDTDLQPAAHFRLDG